MHIGRGGRVANQLAEVEGEGESESVLTLSGPVAVRL